MAIETDTYVTRISLYPAVDLEKTIRELCEIQAARDAPRRLAATFAAEDQVILIFQRAQS